MLLSLNSGFSRSSDSAALLALGALFIKKPKAETLAHQRPITASGRIIHMFDGAFVPLEAPWLL